MPQVIEAFFFGGVFMQKHMATTSHRRWWLTLIGILLILIGGCLLFKEDLKSMMVHHMQDQALEKPIQHPKQHGDFNFDNVKPVSDQDVASAATMNAADVIGKIAIPAVNMKLPIFYGLAQSNLLRGAGTMKPHEQMGEGNYCLAGHHMMDGHILFGPLAQVKVGDEVYLTDKTYVYQYRVTQTQIVNETDTSVLNDVNGERLLTLVTCASGHLGETRRIIVRGQLQWQKVATKHTLSYFKVDGAS